MANVHNSKKEEYIKKHILEYIKFQLNQGYELRDIKKVLVNYGYDRAIVDAVIKGMSKKEKTPKRRPIITKIEEIEEELYNYMLGSIADYIRKEQRQGYEIKMIRKALINYGHHPVIVDDAIRGIKYGTTGKRKSMLKVSQNEVLIVSLLVVVVFITLLAISTKTMLSIVILNFLPSILGIVVCDYIFRTTNSRKAVQLLPLVSAAIVVFSYIFLVQVSPAMRKTSEPTIILSLNVIVAFIFTLLISLFSEKEFDEKRKVIIKTEKPVRKAEHNKEDKANKKNKKNEESKSPKLKPKNANGKIISVRNKNRTGRVKIKEFKV